MNKILSAQKYSTLIFAIDTTGSMREEISAAKAITKEIISGTPESEIDYILSPFNDPGKIYFLQESLTNLGRIFGLSNQTETNILNLYYNFIISFYVKLRKHLISTMTAQTLKFSITDLSSKCDQIRRKLVTLFCRR